MKYVALEEVDSTNDYIKRNINTLEHLTIVSTRFQTGGKGRNGHVWQSEKNKSILMSILLKEYLEPQKVQQLTQVIALAIIEALKTYDIQAQIKWPNDIYVEGLKICGILVESIYHDTLQGVVIGVGLNVNSYGQYQSMANYKGRQYDNKEIMVRILTQFLLYYKIYLQGSYPHILQRVNRLSYLKGKQIEYQEYGFVYFEQLNEDGTITIKDSNGKFHNIYCNEVSLHNKEKIGV